MQFSGEGGETAATCESERMSKFTKFPKMWRQQLEEIRANGCAYRVALYLLERASFSKQVILSTSAMRRLGVSRNGKRGP